MQRDGVRISYHRNGSGEHAVVLLHGLAGHAGEWERSTAALAEQFTTLAVEQRGHGSSTRRPADTSREAFVEDVVAVIKHAGVSPPVTVVGQSMGAHTAFLAAARFPDLVGRLVMVEGSVGGGGSSAARRLHQELTSWPEHFDSYEQVRDFFGGDNPRGRAWAQGYLRCADGWWPRFDRDVLEAVMGPVFATEHWRDWFRLRVPTMLVLAECSGIDSGRIDRMLGERPSTRCVVIPRGGHDLHLDQPDAWIEALRRFLATTPPCR